MEIYEEGNILNGNLRYPQESATMQRMLAEQDFADYLRHTFFRQDGSAYCVHTDNGSYISAARIEKYADGYLLSAVETRPDMRRMGYGKRMLNALLAECTNRGLLPVYSHVDNRNVASMMLHLQCGFQAYKDFARYLDGSINSHSKTLKYEK